MDEQPQQPVQEPAKNPANELQVPAQPNVDSDAPTQPQSQEPPIVHQSPESEPPTVALQPPSIPEPTQPEKTRSLDPNQEPPETTVVQMGGLVETRANETDNVNPMPDEPKTVPQETTLPTAAESTVPAEPAKQEVQEHPASAEREPGEFIEKIVEKEVVRELNEEEQQALYKSRLKSLSTKGNQARSNRRLTNHAKIVEYLKQHGYITNNEVQRICGVKDSTATKYLKELQKLGQIIPVGRTRYIRWRLTQAI